jgi:hypothetical protein
MILAGGTIVLVALMFAAVWTSQASAGDELAQFYSAYSTPTQGGDTGYDNACYPIDGVESSTPGGYYSTVALIDTGGGWRRSARGNTVNVAVFVSPDTVAGAQAYTKKAHCNNSDPINTYLLQCADSWFDVGGICV